MTTRRILPAAMAVWLTIMSCNIPLWNLTATAVPSRTAPVSAPTSTKPPTVTLVLAQAETAPTTPAQISASTTPAPAQISASTTPAPAQTSAPTTLAPAQTSAPTTVEVVTTPPTPLPPKGTCKDGYIFRMAGPTDTVCVPPAAQAQAAADNLAASSRWMIKVFGDDVCIEGYVYREAFLNDRVCVTSAVRAQAAEDYAARWTRWLQHGEYGQFTCIAGYVWRMAQPGTGDKVCVTGAVYDQVVADNAADYSRKAIHVIGPEACMPGFVWRLAFTNDHMCVTPAVQNQVLWDNVAAPSRTW